jgi:ribosomal protein L27
MAGRRMFVVIPVVTFLSLLMAVLVFGTASSQVLTTLSLNLQRSQPDAVIDGGKPGPSIGDVAFIKALLTDDAENQVGAIIAQVSRFSTAGSESHAAGTITLKQRGTLIFSGKLNLSGRTENQGTIAIVGGTADFEGAQGVATSTIDDTGSVHIELTLI